VAVEDTKWLKVCPLILSMHTTINPIVGCYLSLPIFSYILRLTWFQQHYYH